MLVEMPVVRIGLSHYIDDTDSAALKSYKLSLLLEILKSLYERIVAIIDDMCRSKTLVATMTSLLKRKVCDISITAAGVENEEIEIVNEWWARGGLLRAF